MYPKPQTYPAIYIIFTLLNALRRGIERKNIWRDFRRQGIALKPRLSFWVALCMEAELIKTDTRYELRVASFARQWLGKPPDEQMFHLIESWGNAPKNNRVRMFRRKLLWKLRNSQSLTQKDQGALNGLDALGLTDHGELTQWGIFFVKGEGALPSPKAEKPCHLLDGQFIAHLTEHIDLLWDLERYLRPKSPGVYPLTKRSLQFLDGDPYEMIDLMERGLGKPMSEHIKAIILKQPSIRITNGIVLEFSSPAELKQLRRQPVFRKYIDKFLSPQRVLISQEKADDLFKMLSRRGVYAYRGEEQPEVSKKRTHYREAYQPKPVMNPVGKNVSKMSIIERYKQLELALDILYRVPGYPAEQRRITPLLVEERGGHVYVIAFCQTRRAQRTFRLDRIEIPGTW